MRSNHFSTLVRVELIRIALRCVFVEITIFKKKKTNKKKQKSKQIEKRVFSDAIGEVLASFLSSPLRFERSVKADAVKIDKSYVIKFTMSFRMPARRSIALAGARARPRARCCRSKFLLRERAS